MGVLLFFCISRMMLSFFHGVCLFFVRLLFLLLLLWFGFVCVFFFFLISNKAKLISLAPISGDVEIGDSFSQISFCSAVINIPISHSNSRSHEGFFFMLFPVVRNHFLPLLACPCDSPTGFIGFIEFIWFIRMKPFSSICSYHVFFPIIHPQCFSLRPFFSGSNSLKPGHTSHLTSCPVVFWGFPCLPAGDMD